MYLKNISQVLKQADKKPRKPVRIQKVNVENKAVEQSNQTERKRKYKSYFDWCCRDWKSAYYQDINTVKDYSQIRNLLEHI